MGGGVTIWLYLQVLGWSSKWSLNGWSHVVCFNIKVNLWLKTCLPPQSPEHITVISMFSRRKTKLQWVKDLQDPIRRSLAPSTPTKEYERKINKLASHAKSIVGFYTGMIPTILWLYQLLFLASDLQSYFLALFIKTYINAWLHALLYSCKCSVVHYTSSYFVDIQSIQRRPPLTTAPWDIARRLCKWWPSKNHLLRMVQFYCDST